MLLSATFISLLLLINQNSNAQISEQDSLALIALYDSTNGSSWTNNENWLTGPVSTWYGITTSANRVTLVNMNNNNLIGTIPPEMGNLTSMTGLYLGRNQLTGEIPVEIFDLSELIDLYLYQNQLGGEIPIEIGNLANLKLLVLMNNQLTGEIPVEIGNLSSLEALAIRDNEFSGEIPIAIGNLLKLTSLDLRGNQLIGEIPHEIGNLIKLTNLELSQNKLSGELPIEIGNLTNLLVISLSQNQLSGDIPSEIGNLAKLTELYLFKNKLSGSIPTEIGNLTGLSKLYLSDNQLSGEIPSNISELVNLEMLYLMNNQLTGVLPSGIANLINLERLYLNNNNFVGAIPEEIINLTKLQDIQLFDNQFTDLPDLSSITTINELEIQRNKFTFEDIEPNITISFISYSPQDSIGEKIDTTFVEDTTLTISVDVGGSSNLYQWKKDGAEITGATESLYTIDSIDASDAGLYICEITNTIATELTLYSRAIHVKVVGAVEVEETESLLPTKLTLFQNYPNPFNPNTTIKYSVPKQSNVTLKVFDVLGSEVASLVNAEQPQGNYVVELDGKNLTSGIYFYRLQAGDPESSSGQVFVETKKMIVLK
jgi:Leucine-rich repeat (LRR) protein